MGPWPRTGSVIILAVACTMAAAPAGAAPDRITARLSSVVSLGVSGVSAHPVPLAGSGTQLYYSSMDGGTAVDLCTDAGACTRQGLLRGVNDVTVVTLRSGARRGYFVQFDPATQAKAMSTAVFAADGLSYADPVPLGIASAPGERAWGVPDAVVLPDGRVRLYWVESIPSGPRAGEAIVSATSPDASGTSFVRDPGYRTTGGVVDFEVLQAVPGRWIAIASTTPGRPPQALLMASSRDGLAWQVNRDPISPRTANYLDPAGVPTGRNTFRIFFTTSPRSDPFNGFVLRQATLTVRTPW